MARPCKVCSSPLKTEIDKQILDGVSFNQLEKFCLDQGLRITGKSIGEHARHHVAEYSSRSETGFNYSPTDSPRNQTMSETIPDPFIIEPISLRNQGLSEIVKLGLTEILANQLAIVKAKQLSFMNGKSKYPSDEIRGLSIIINCFESLTGKSPYNHRASHILDLDTTLRNKQDL